MLNERVARDSVITLGLRGVRQPGYNCPARNVNAAAFDECVSR
jgi:hypothetical protein